MMQFPFDLTPLLINGGSLQTTESKIIRLTLPYPSKKYCDAQLDDYQTLSRKHFRWSSPCRMEIRARASYAQPPGTLGFGFWNDPFTLSLGQGGAAQRLPAIPQTIWFFYGSSENDIRLNPDLPGSGWKASVIRSPNIPSLVLAPAALAAFPLSSLSMIRSLMMKIIYRKVIAEEALLDCPLDEWHTYSINWKINEVTFHVEGKEVLCVEDPPTCPLGFVAWIDNQFAVASPESRFRFGLLPTLENQWFELEITHLESL